MLILLVTVLNGSMGSYDRHNGRAQKQTSLGSSDKYIDQREYTPGEPRPHRGVPGGLKTSQLYG